MIVIPHTKVNAKWVKDLEIRKESIKFLEEDTAELSRKLTTRELSTV